MPAEHHQEQRQEWHDDHAKHREQQLLPVEPSQRDPQQRELLVERLAPDRARKGAQPPSAEAISRGSVADICTTGVSGLVRGQSAQYLAKVRPCWQQSPDQQRHAGAEQDAPEKRELQPSDHRATSLSSFSPMNRGSGRPAAIRRIHTSTPPYAASISARTSWPRLLRYGAT